MTEETTALLAPVIKPGSKYYRDFKVALDQARAVVPEVAPAKRDDGPARSAGRDAAGVAASGGTAVAPSPSSGGGSSRGKAHARKWGSLGGGGGASPSPSAARARRASPPAAGATARGGTAHGTPVTPAKSGGGGGGGGAGASDDGERPRKRAKVTPARSAGRGLAPAAGGGGGGSRRKVGPSRRALQGALVAAQAELSVLRARLATAEAAAAAVTEPLSWEGIKGALKRFDLRSELPTAALASARARDRRASGGKGAGVASEGVDRYEVPKAERMVVSVTTSELKEAVNAISAAGKRIGAAAAAADQQRAAFKAVLGAIPLREAATPGAGGARSAAPAAAAAMPSPAADVGVAGARGRSSAGGRTVGDATALSACGGAPLSPAAADGAIPAEVAEAAHVVAFAEQFKEWAVLRAEQNAAEAALEAAVRRVIAMRVTLVQLSVSQAGKPVRVTFQRYYKISPAVDILCTALIDQWMEFISRATMQDLSPASTPAETPAEAPAEPASAAAAPTEAGWAAAAPGSHGPTGDPRPQPPPASEADADRQQAWATPAPDVCDGVGGALNVTSKLPATADATQAVTATPGTAADGQTYPRQRPPPVAAPSGAAPINPPSLPAAGACSAEPTTSPADRGEGGDAPSPGGEAAWEGHPLDGYATDGVVAMVP